MKWTMVLLALAASTGDTARVKKNEGKDADVEQAVVTVTKEEMTVLAEETDCPRACAMCPCRPQPRRVEQSAAPEVGEVVGALGTSSMDVESGVDEEEWIVSPVYFEGSSKNDEGIKGFRYDNHASDRKLRAELIKLYGKQDPSAPSYFVHGSDDDPSLRNSSKNTEQLWTVSFVDETQDLCWTTKFAMHRLNSDDICPDNLGYPTWLGRICTREAVDKMASSREVLGYISLWKRTKECSFTQGGFGYQLRAQSMAAGKDHVYARTNYPIMLPAGVNAPTNNPDSYVFTPEAYKVCGLQLTRVYAVKAGKPEL